VFEVAFGGIVNDVLKAHCHCFVAEFHWERLVGLIAQAVKEQRVNRRGLFADESGECGALGAMTFACGAETAEEMDLECRRFREFVWWEFRRALVERGRPLRGG